MDDSLWDHIKRIGEARIVTEVKKDQRIQGLDLSYDIRKLLGTAERVKKEGGFSNHLNGEVRR